MAEIITLPKRDEWIASFDLVNRPDVGWVLVLTDCRRSFVEGEGSPGEKLQELADMALNGAREMKNEGLALEIGNG